MLGTDLVLEHSDKAIHGLYNPNVPVSKNQRAPFG